MRATSRPVGHIVFSAWADRICVKESVLSLFLWGWNVLHYGLLIKAFICPSISSEDKVIEHYKKLKGVTRGQAIVQ